MSILQDWFKLMQEHEQDLATILSYENGRPIEAAKAEIRYAASFFEWFSGEAVRSYGQTIQGTLPENRVLTIKQPVGVVGVLTPWNFPSAMITRKAGAVSIPPQSQDPWLMSDIVRCSWMYSSSQARSGDTFLSLSIGRSR